MSTVEADTKVDAARAKVQEWGAKLAAGTWDWHPLGHALQLAHEAVEAQHTYQRPWTLLADIYHRIGKLHLARECLVRSYELATPGPNHPGRFYRSVEANLKTGYPFDTKGGVKRQSPPEWFDSKYQRYWLIDGKLLTHYRNSPLAAVPTVFLSYAREDAEAAERLRADLDARGFAVWMDTKRLLPGEQWEQKIRESIRSHDFVVICLSRTAVAKIGFFQVELRTALRWQEHRPPGHVFLIPVRFDDCDVPPELHPYHYVDLFGGHWNPGVQAIGETILAHRRRAQGSR